MQPAAAYPHVRAEGASNGITMFALAHKHVMRRGIAAGELGSVFGHRYIAGGNFSECLVGGQIAGRSAAGLTP